MKKLILTLALLCAALPAAAAPTMLQNTSCNVGASRPTAPTCTFASNVTAGSQLLFWIIDDRSSATITTGPGDTVVANAWFTQSTAGNIWNLLYHVTSAIGGATTVTFSYGAATNFAVVMEEWTGLDTSQLFVDVYKKQLNTTTTVGSCGTTTGSNSANEVVWAVYSSYQGASYSGGPPAGYSLSNETTNTSADTIHVYNKQVTGAFGTYTAASLTLSASQTNFCTIVVGRAAATGTVTTSALTSPGTCADLAGTGTVVWTNPTNAQVADGVYATSSAGTTHYLKCTNFGFAVTGTVIGVQLTLVEDADCTIGCDGTVPLQIKLNLAAGISGNNRCSAFTYNSSADSASCSQWSLSPTTKTFGGQNDTWGLTLATSDINNANFGAVISLSNDNSSGGTMTGKVDVMQITVYTLSTVKRRVEIMAQTGYAYIQRGM
jgi:hypothetical protein